jgi:hypothetical protein
MDRTQKETLLEPGYASPTGRHEKIPAGRAINVISFLFRGYDAFLYLQYTVTHTDPDHNMSDCIRYAIIL